MPPRKGMQASLVVQLAGSAMNRVPEIMLNEMIQKMVAADLADAKKHALLKKHGYTVNVSAE